MALFIGDDMDANQHRNGRACPGCWNLRELQFAIISMPVEPVTGIDYVCFKSLIWWTG
jgi:hypothetical protein